MKKKCDSGLTESPVEKTDDLNLYGLQFLQSDPYFADRILLELFSGMPTRNSNK